MRNDMVYTCISLYTKFSVYRVEFDLFEVKFHYRNIYWINTQSIIKSISVSIYLHFCTHFDMYDI